MATYEIMYVRRKISDDTPPVLGDARAAASYVRSACFPDEECWRERSVAVYTDSKNRCLGQAVISVGGPDSCPIDVRLVCKGALDALAKNVILAHNHPTGDPTPSKCDIEQTGRLKRALDTLGVKLIDHVVLGESAFYSFASEKEERW